MAKVIALCGKICSGKSTLARQLRDELPAVILNSDELTLAIPFEHDVLYPIIRDYLMLKAVQIVRAGANVVLDFGFWSRADRSTAKEFFKQADIELEWRYIAVTDDDWHRNISSRNEQVLCGEAEAYFVDEGLARKCLELFEEPEPGELE